VTGALSAAVERAQRLGFLGPGPVEDHLRHARSLARLVGPAPSAFLDLGSGGGLPGLVLALDWPTARAVLLDAHQRRGTHLAGACEELGIADRVSVVVDRAEHAAHDPRWRGQFPLVVARAFGPPAVTAECAVGFLAPDGTLVVSEPPGGDPRRWDEEGLRELGLGVPDVVTGDAASAARLRLEHPPADRWPRRTGVPSRRPLWR